jgi:hypothetical protein
VTDTDGGFVRDTLDECVVDRDIVDETVKDRDALDETVTDGVTDGMKMVDAK